MTLHNSTARLVTNDYPYGRLRCTMAFSQEFKMGKGFRSVRQSTNPKTGRVNKPKKSTYYQIMLPVTHVKIFKVTIKLIIV